MNALQYRKSSPVGIELVRLLAREGDRIFSTARARELAPQVGLKDAYLAESLYHLRQTGWIVPLRRGLYALSSTVPGVTPAHEFEIAMALVEPAAISHWSALHHHGLTEQSPRTVFVLTTTVAAVPRKRGPQANTSARGFPVGDTTYQSHGAAQGAHQCALDDPGEPPGTDRSVKALRTRLQTAREYAPVEILWERYTEKEPHPGGQEAFTIRAQLPWQRRPQTRVIVETAVDERILKPVTSMKVIHEYGEPFHARVRDR